MDTTKSTNTIYVDDEFFRTPDITKMGRILNLETAETLLNNYFKLLVDEVQQLYSNKQWIEIENKKVYIFHNKNSNLIIPDLNRMDVGEASTYYNINYNNNNSYKYTSFEGFNGHYLGSYNVVMEIFFNNKSKCPFSDRYGYITYVDSNNNWYWCGNGYNCRYDCSYTYTAKHITVFDLKLKDLLKNLIEYDLVPTKLSSNGKELLKMIKDGYIKIGSKNVVSILEPLEDIIVEGNGIPDILQDLLSDDSMATYMKEYVKTHTVDLTDDLLKVFGKPYLECDLYRADIEPYDLKCLTDINGGHWELWSDEVPPNKTKVEISTALVGRNPIADVHYDGLVGIDFGTKSTVVAYQDGTDKTYLQRIGMGRLSKRPEAKHYENPTVMEFIDIESFLESYESSKGRPETSWDDLTVSHTAQNDLNESSDSDSFYSYFYDLKQWCGDTTSNRQLKIKDQCGDERVLSSFVSLEEDDFNPIEVYAYYLGLFINNMRNGIYIDYIMSFPVTYEKTVRDKILQSFQAGLKKSLPNEVLQDEDIMSKFRVQAGASEPACYAICALQQFNIEPRNDEHVFYSIFDFGGGTTDFDFGIWRLANEDEPREEDYDYVIQHFGAGGDQYLGGENLLELLSYEVFKFNADVLLPNASKDSSVGYSFFKPAECDIFNGSEVLLSNSQEAKRNTKSLMEKLRPFMETLTMNDDGEILATVDYQGEIKVDLFDKNGNMKTAIPLKLNNGSVELNLIQILEDRIKQGVENFFQALKINLDRSENENCNEIYIFLAGNSSKSPIVKKLFKEYTEAHSLNSENYSDLKVKIFAPLGTEEANEIQEKNGITVDLNDITRATGKTGVAYGLLDGRQGSNILVKSEVTATQEVPFKYYIGLNKRKRFKPVLLKGSEYNKWIRFKNALTSDFYIYYSNLPVVENCETSIEDIKKRKCILPKSYDDESYSIYVRPVKPNVIEYAVATEEGIKSEDYILEPQTLELVI